MSEYINCINKETHDLLFNDKNLSKPEKDTTEYDKILDEINSFTRLADNNLRDKIMKSLSTLFNNISFDDKNNQYNYQYKDKSIPFKKLSDCIGDESIRKELLSTERNQQCHTKSMQLVQQMGTNAKVVTGIYARHGLKHLHSIVEIERENEEDNDIIDYTMNLIMKKKYYNELTQFKQIEQINDLEVLEDRKEGRLDTVDMSIKTYLTFRDELKVDFDKNDSMLNKKHDIELDNKIEDVKNRREEENENAR